MEFFKYQHLEKFGFTEVRGIEHGTCYIFPKIDGTNGQLWYDGYDMKGGSRNRVLSLDNDNQGFLNWATTQNNIRSFFRNNPEVRLFGEWLVPHTLTTYQDSAWRKFYVFDVMKGEEYIPYEEYKLILEKHGIDYIPALCKVENPGEELLYSFLEKNTYLIKDGGGFGEGIVIKNYEYKNGFGRQIWAKIIRNEFKAKHLSIDIQEVKAVQTVEQKIVDTFCTKSLIEKEHAKIVAESGWSSTYIPKLLNIVFYCLVKEECWNFLKEFDFPAVDFNRLKNLSFKKVRQEIPNLF